MSRQILDFVPGEQNGWMRDASCAAPGAPDMFPHDTQESSIQEARNLCLQCPVREICLAGALLRNEPYGIWGGLTTAERQTRRRREAREYQRSQAWDRHLPGSQTEHHHS